MFSERRGAAETWSPPIDSYVTVLAAEMNTRCVPVHFPEDRQQSG